MSRKETDENKTRKMVFSFVLFYFIVFGMKKETEKELKKPSRADLDTLPFSRR